MAYLPPDKCHIYSINLSLSLRIVPTENTWHETKRTHKGILITLETQTFESFVDLKKYSYQKNLKCK